MLKEVLAGEYPLDLRGVVACALRSYPSPSAKTLAALRCAPDEVSLLGEVATETLAIIDP